MRARRRSLASLSILVSGILAATRSLGLLITKLSPPELVGFSNRGSTSSLSHTPSAATMTRFSSISRLKLRRKHSTFIGAGSMAITRLAPSSSASRVYAPTFAPQSRTTSPLRIPHTPSRSLRSCTSFFAVPSNRPSALCDGLSRSRSSTY